MSKYIKPDYAITREEFIEWIMSLPDNTFLIRDDFYIRSYSPDMITMWKIKLFYKEPGIDPKGL